MLGYEVMRLGIGGWLNLSQCSRTKEHQQRPLESPMYCYGRWTDSCMAHRTTGREYREGCCLRKKMTSPWMSFTVARTSKYTKGCIL